MQTAAGNVEFTNDAVFSHDWTGYHLIWQDQLIFPELSATDKVQVTSEEAKRGDILDRNGRQLAGEGTASSVGIVPGRMETVSYTHLDVYTRQHQYIFRSLRFQW